MGSSQKFIARNRAPRVQIEYDVEVYGAEKKVQLPFVMGVMSDLSGKPAEPLPAGGRPQVSRDRHRQLRFAHEVDEAARGLPGAQYAHRRGQPDGRPHLREHGRLLARGRGQEGGRAGKLLEARQQLQNLVTYMDGKGGAEGLVGRLMSDPSLLASLATSAKPTEAPKT
jgi:type VI secretion system protein ImpB